MAPPLILSMFFYDTRGEPKKVKRFLMNMSGVRAVTVDKEIGMIHVEGPSNAAISESIRSRLQEMMRRSVSIVSNAGPEPEYSGTSPGPPPPARLSGYPPPDYPPPPPPPRVQYIPPPPPAPATNYGDYPPSPPHYAPTPPPQIHYEQSPPHYAPTPPPYYEYEPPSPPLYAPPPPYYGYEPPPQTHYEPSPPHYAPPPSYYEPPVQEPGEYQWQPYNREHIYTPSFLSDENPNSCSIQ